MNLLIVEDLESLAQNLKAGFEQNSFKASISHSGEDAFFKLNTENFDLIVLDWMLPDRNGIEILQQIRKMDNWVPVIMLTARDTVDDRVKGLESGADDYLIKPFAFAELLARVNSHLRRDVQNKKSNLIKIGDLTLSTEDQSVSREGVNIHLTQREFDILLYLCRHQGQAVTRQMLTKDVWKIESRATPMDSVIDVHINRLRKKVDAPFENKMIKTVRGVGFELKC